MTFQPFVVWHHRSLGQTVFATQTRGLRFPLVELANALTPGYDVPSLRDSGDGRSEHRDAASRAFADLQQNVW